MRVDTHVHTFYSGSSTIHPLATAHSMLEDRFNRALLFDLVARPAGRAVVR